MPPFLRYSSYNDFYKLTEVFYDRTFPAALQLEASGTALKTIASPCWWTTSARPHRGRNSTPARLDIGTLAGHPSAYPLYRLDMVLRFTGRLAFPIFCFLLVEALYIPTM